MTISTGISITRNFAMASIPASKLPVAKIKIMASVGDPCGEIEFGIDIHYSKAGR